MEILSGFAMVREQVLAELNSAARLQLTPEQQQRIESIYVNEAGIASATRPTRNGLAVSSQN